MHGWGDDSASDDDWISKRQKVSCAKGRTTKGRGFTASGGEDASTGGAEDDTVEHVLQKDYTRYEIDPDDTWRPHRKPWAELTGNWEFSAAWSFEPDENERREESPESQPRVEPKGVLVWRVEHAKGGDFTAALAAGSAGDARSWLE